MYSTGNTTKTRGLIMISSSEFKAIADLDLDPIKVKLMHVESGEGWSLERVNAVEVEYRRFLYLMKMYPNEETAPQVDVDTFWHYHILDTMKYAKDCQQAFGYFLHHYPYIGLRGEDDVAVQQRAGERMRELYAEAFGAPMTEGQAWCGAAVQAAWCGAADEAGKAAWCGAAVKTAWCGAAKPAAEGAVAATAWCGAAVKTAWCGAAKPAAEGAVAATAWCGAAVKTAWCGAAKPAAEAAVAATAWCGAATKQSSATAWCGAATKQSSATAWCGAATKQSSATAWCGAATKQSSATAWCGAASTVKRAAQTETALAA
jgi:hypothetical protein